MAYKKAPSIEHLQKKQHQTRMKRMFSKPRILGYKDIFGKKKPEA